MKNGTDFYNEKINNKIDHLLVTSNKPYLKGFRYSLTNLALSSVYDYLCRVNNFIDFTEKKPEDLNIDDYNIFIGSLGDKTASYRIVTYAALKKFSGYLKAREINVSDPMQYVYRPKFEESIETYEKRQKGYLSVDEISELTSNIKAGVGSSRSRSRQNSLKERDLAIVAIFLGTGMRCSALCKLDINNIDFQNHVIKVRDKGSKIRVYELPDGSWNPLIEWLDKRSSFVAGDNPALFVKTNGERIGYYGVRELVMKYSMSIDGKHITPHKLRATYGTQLYNKTRDIYFVQKCMGHQSASTTALYIRGVDEEMKKASEIMNAIITC